MEVFDNNDTVDNLAVAKVLAFMALLAKWNDALGAKAGSLITRLEKYPNYLSDTEHAEMMTLFVTGERMEEIFQPCKEYISKTIAPLLESNDEEDLKVPMVPFYEMVFKLAEVKPYIVEMDRLSDNLGIKVNLGPYENIGECLDQLLTRL